MSVQRNLKALLRPVPQPYKRWVARALMVPFFIALVPFAAAVEGSRWVRETAGEVVEAFREVKDW